MLRFATTIVADERVTRALENPRLSTADKEALIRISIKELAEQVDPGVFWQIHRGTIVNVGYIAGVTRDMRGHMALRLKKRSETLSVSDSYTHLFKQM